MGPHLSTGVPAPRRLRGDRPDRHPRPGRAWPMRRRPGCRRSSGCTRRSCRCSPTRCSGHRGSSSSARIRRSSRSSRRRSCRWPPATRDARSTLAALLAVIVGVVIVVAGVARLGFLTDLLSAPVRHGYLNGIALIVIVSQLPRLFGFTTDGRFTLLDAGQSFLGGPARRRRRSRPRWRSGSRAWS